MRTTHLVHLVAPAVALGLAALGVAAQAQPSAIVWDGNGVAPALVERLTCKDVGIGANLLGNPVTGDSTTTAERFFLVQKRALECLPRAAIEARRLILAKADTLDPAAVERALAMHRLADAELFTQLKKHIPSLSKRIVNRSQFSSVNPRARSGGDPTRSGYDIDKGQYPWIWSVGPAKRRAITPLTIAFGVSGRATFAGSPAIRQGLSSEAYGYLVGPDRPVNGSFRARQEQMTANVTFFAPPGPTPDQQRAIDEMLQLGRERLQTVLCYVERTGAEPAPGSTCSDPRFDAVRGRTLAAIEAEDQHCRIEMADLGVPQLPPHLPPYFIGSGHRDLNALCKNAQRTFAALSVWHQGLSHGSDPLESVNAIAGGYANGVIIADRSSDFRFDLEAVPWSQLMRKILVLRHLEVPGRDGAGNCPLVARARVVNDPELLESIARYARKIRIPRRGPGRQEPAA